MRQVRLATFETNSSSTHTLVIVSKEEFEKWKRGELYLEDSVMKTKDQVLLDNKKLIDTYNDGDVDEFISDERMDYESYFDRDMETFTQEHKTPNGDEVVAFGYFGYDG